MKKFTLAVWLSSSLVASWSSSASAQCSLPSCSTVEVFPWTMPEEEEQLVVPDRRPVAVVNLYSANFGWNTAGLFAWWCRDAYAHLEASADDCDYPGEDTGSTNGVPDDFDYLLARLDQAHYDGFRRIVMHMPAGHVYGQQLYSGSQWYTMPAWKRAALTYYVGGWINEKNDGLESDDPEYTTVGVYIGFSTDDPPDPCSLVIDSSLWDPPHLPDPEDADDMCALWQNVSAWSQAGIYDIWFDYAAVPPGPDYLSQLHYSPNYDGVYRFGGESIPISGVSGIWRLVDWDHLYKTRWVATQVEAEKIHPLTAFPTGTTEVSVWFSGHSPYQNFTIEDVQRWVSRGAIAWASVSSASGNSFSAFRGAEYIKRVYNWPYTRFIPLLSVAEDLNADGAVDALDCDHFNQFYPMASGATLYHGDLDNDGDVDSTDRAILNGALGYTCTP